MQELDKIAQKVFGEFGFTTCTLHQQETILTYYSNFKNICNEQ